MNTTSSPKTCGYGMHMIDLGLLKSDHTSLVIPIFGIVLAFYQNIKWKLETHHIKWEMAQEEGILPHQWVFTTNIRIPGEIDKDHAVA